VTDIGVTVALFWFIYLLVNLLDARLNRWAASTESKIDVVLTPLVGKSLRIFVIIGALSAFIGLAAGAFGAHGLKSRLRAEMLSIFEVGVQYQMYHAFALIVAAWMQSKWPSSLVTTGGWLFVIGTVLFSGSLYLLGLSGTRWLAAITPLGGLSLLVGWICLALAAWRA
jgi:uncharacterized membrane protein YgdD (TMEM256/DUF423 family)